MRTQAALALGASQQSSAVTPLCFALSDSHRTVRIATATALSRLNRGGSECIQSRLRVEDEASVLAALKRALAALGGAGAEPAIGPSTSLLVALDKVIGPERLNDPVRAAFVKGAAGRQDIAFAPRGQSVEEAEASLEAHPRVRAYLLSPKLSRPQYSGGALTIKVSVAILSYPGRALVGSYSKTATVSGVSSADQDLENQMVESVSEAAMKQFLALAPGLN